MSSDARFHEGKQWGVRFSDGSVAHRWNGRTQRQRAEEYVNHLRMEYGVNEWALVYREGPDAPWKEP